MDDTDYYLAGAPDGPGGAYDVPGHFWHMAGPDKLVGEHYNYGPFGESKFWSSDAENATLLYKVSGIIDTWSPEKAGWYAKRGYIHYHELIEVEDPHDTHLTKVVWLKHTAVDKFTFDPHMAPYPHNVTLGVDYIFMPNYMNPYPPMP
ncbi:MAG: hypothetical protein K8R08_09755 [Methanosarcinales archaeon]|nr:hypothetical protein [Methanosarcinales archaeon]